MLRSMLGAVLALVGIALTAYLMLRLHSVRTTALGGVLVLAYVGFLVDQLLDVRRKSIRARYSSLKVK